MTLQDLGSIGEFVAAIATLITLIYLAAQIRQNTRSVRTASAQAVLAALNQAIQAAAASPQLARVVVLGQTNFDELSEGERLQWVIWLLGWCRIVEQAYHSYLLGQLDARSWSGHARHMESIVQAPSFDRYWRVRHSLYSPEFQQFIAECRERASTPPATELAEAMLRDEPAAKQGAAADEPQRVPIDP